MNGERKRTAVKVIGWRIQAAIAQGWRCLWCDRVMANRRVEMREFPHLRVTADHLIPEGLGGPNERWNIVAACSQCNHSRGNKLVGTWIELLRERYTEAQFAVLLQKVTRFGIDACIGQPALAAPTVENPIVRAPEVETSAP